MKKIAPLVQRFFTERLNQQLQVSHQTVSSYRDTLKILFLFVKEKINKNPYEIDLEDINSKMIGDFLNHLEGKRGNSVRTRNTRLAAIHSFFRFVSYLEPAYSEQVQRIMSIPQKRYEKRIVTYLTDEEIRTLLEAPDKSTWLGRRDYTLLVVGIHTGLRVSELIGLKIDQIKWGTGAHIRCLGKGRKERCSPLTQRVQKILRDWVQRVDRNTSQWVFPSRVGTQLSRDAIEKLIRKHKTKAQNFCPSLREKNVTPHVLRHTTAVQLLQANVDISLIALFLGHESIDTTQIYLAADLTIKEKALEKVQFSPEPFKRFKADDQLLGFLDGL